jgi:protein-S-isoprenylcysteine O-methyltransferase Ste14
MALIEEYNKTGNWLFKYRSYLPLIFFILATAVVILDKNVFADFSNIYFSIICVSISLAGQVIRALTIGYTPKATSGRNTKQQVADVLNTKGLYSTLRHPLYLGNFFMWIGIVVYVGNVWFIISCILLFWIYYERIMFAEEFFLRNKFKEEYIKWAEKIPPFLPRFKHYKETGFAFSMRNVLKREYHGFFAIFISFSYINFIKNYIENKIIYLDTFWQISLGFSLIVFITLRILRKNTNILNVEGR